MKKSDYTISTLEEYFALPQTESTVIALPAKALKEIEAVKAHSELVNKTLKKYLINARQAQTNAKIVEALIG